MTAKEKAKELIENYEFVYIQNYSSMREVKQCALIAVDEILKVLHTNIENRYWQQVKQEIEKL